MALAVDRTERIFGDRGAVDRNGDAQQPTTIRALSMEEFAVIAATGEGRPEFRGKPVLNVGGTLKPGHKPA